MKINAVDCSDGWLAIRSKHGRPIWHPAGAKLSNAASRARPSCPQEREGAILLMDEEAR
jgi:hypothetical protein